MRFAFREVVPTLVAGALILQAAAPAFARITFRGDVEFSVTVVDSPGP